jgi:hypothetical protein
MNQDFIVTITVFGIFLAGVIGFASEVRARAGIK